MTRRNERSRGARRMLVLGSGFVAKPLVDELLGLLGVEVTVATQDVARGRRLVDGHDRGSVVELDVADEARLSERIRRADAVVSLLPATRHVAVAEQCVAHGVPLVTTSYISPEMRALDGPARTAGVLLLNECGLDPGLDHITAMRVIRRVRREGGRVVSLASVCGGLPAPDANTNPWGYKFTWSPRGVLFAARQPVRYLENGAVVSLEPTHMFDAPRRMLVPGVGALEAYPNRDALPYGELYGLEQPRYLWRGTLRYPGWCETWRSIARLGVMDLEEHDWSGCSYAEWLGRHLPDGQEGLVTRLARSLEVSEDHDVVARFEWMGLLSDRPVPIGRGSSLDVLAERMERKLRYAEGERDMVILQHDVVATRADGTLRRIRVRILEFAEAGDDSAMARTVSLPAAIACRLLLEGRIDLTGVRIPVDFEIAAPILLELHRHGIEVEESEEDLPSTGL